MQRKRKAGIVKRRNATPVEINTSKHFMSDTLDFITKVYSTENDREITIRVVERIFKCYQ